MTAYRKEVLESAIDSLNAHIQSTGGKVENPNDTFDPYKPAISSTTRDPKLPVEKSG